MMRTPSPSLSPGVAERTSWWAAPGARRPLILAALALHGALLALALLNSGGRFNEDAVAYVAIARHYEAGRYHLAVNGYWGPLFSWSLVPLLRLGIDPILAARIVNILSSGLFLAASAMLFRGFGLRGLGFALCLIVTALFSAYWAVNIISPDLLLASLLLAGIALALDEALRTRAMMLAGACFGAAYLAKPVGLPIALLSIGALAALHILLGRAPRRRSIARLALCLAVTAAVSLPWIATTSIGAGHPTFTTALGISRAIVGGGGVIGGHPAFATVHRPRDGRTTSWENPPELAYPSAAPAQAPPGFDRQVRGWLSNGMAIIGILSDNDLFGLGLAFTILSGVLLLIGIPDRRRPLWAGATLLLVALCAVYLPVYGGLERYYLAAFPILLAASACFATDFLPRRWAGRALLLVFFSFLAQLAPRMAASLAADRSVADFVTAERLVERATAGGIAPGGIVSYAPAVRASKAGFYTAFLMDRPYFGLATDRAGLCRAAAMGARYVVVEGPGTAAPLAGVNRRLHQPARSHGGAAVASLFSAAALCEGAPLRSAGLIQVSAAAPGGG